MSVSQLPAAWGLKFFRTEQVMTLLVAALIGALAAVGALIFRAMILGSEKIFWGTTQLTAEYINALPWWWQLLAPALGALLIAPIVVKYAPQARGSGIPEVIEATALHGAVVPRRIVPLKAIAAALTIGSGGSAGREGPIVHIGAAIGSWLAQYYRVSVRETRTYVGCGVAGGIAATFNTPFAGALFAVEVVLGDFGTAKISPIVIASIVATVISRHYKGNFPHIDVPAFEEVTTFQSLLIYVGVGVACGFTAALFIKMMVRGWKLAGRWPWSPYLMPAAGGLAVGATGLLFPQVYGVGYDTINAVLEGNLDIKFMMLLVGAKLLATCFTLCSGGSGGIFAPSLFIGAIIGGICGQFFNLVAPGVVSSSLVYVLVGMGAMVAGATRAPISAILVIFELTYAPSIIVPLMAACIPALLVSSTLHADSIYIAKLTQKGVRLKKQHEVNLLKGMHVNDVMQSRVPAVAPSLPLVQVLEKFMASSFPVMWMTDDKGKLLGVLESTNLQIALLEREALSGLIVAEDVAIPPGAVLRPRDDLSFAMRLFDDVEYQILPVVDADSGRVVADLLRSDVMHAYNRELAMRDSLAVAVDAIGVAERLGTVDLGDGYALIEYEVPSHLIGKSFKELELRRRFGLQAVLIKRGTARLVPGPDTQLESGDVVLFAGEAGDLQDRLAKL